MSKLKLDGLIPSEDMKRDVLIQLLQSKGLATYGTKSDMINRYNKSFIQEGKPTISQLHGVCKFYGITQPKTHVKLYELLKENNTVWKFDSIAKTITHYQMVSMDNNRDDSMDSVFDDAMYNNRDDSMDSVLDDAMDNNRDDGMDSVLDDAMDNNRDDGMDNEEHLLRNSASCDETYQSVAALNKCNVYQCNVCRKEFNSHDSYHYHRSCGHADFTNKMIIGFENSKMLLEPYSAEKNKDRELFQLVGTPWVDENGQLVKLSIGLTTKHNVVAYAKCIWSKVKCALKKKQLKVVGCGSAVNAAAYFNIEMAPEKAFSFGLIMHKRIVGNKVKGFCRDILDAIKRMSANDIFGFLEPMYQIIIEQIVKCIEEGKITESNCEAFLCNVTENNIDVNKRKFNLQLISDILLNLGIIDKVI